MELNQIVAICIADSHLTRKVPATYADGVYMMGGDNRPNARKLSELFMKGPDGLGSVMNRTALFAFFGTCLILCFVHRKEMHFSKHFLGFDKGENFQNLRLRTKSLNAVKITTFYFSIFKMNQSSTSI